eukprot:TRINITY_DN6535_c0_g1_i1.p1 TRINITY_DN6535_c0_g1~~TRINITY_DN6535_c0_g1_i1.p1  ORF type:complete len:681 (-),score=184.82 TRINITY_DN6535_c0_g1_i1:810-2852(-)
MEVQVPLWSKHKVVEWVLSLNPAFHKYGSSFLQNEINGEALLALTETDLKKDLGIPLGHAKIILNAINSLDVAGVDPTEEDLDRREIERIFEATKDASMRKVETYVKKLWDQIDQFKNHQSNLEKAILQIKDVIQRIEVSDETIADTMAEDLASIATDVETDFDSDSDDESVSSARTTAPEKPARKPPTVPPPERPHPTQTLLEVPTKYPPQNYRLSFSLKDIQDIQTVQPEAKPPTPPSIAVSSSTEQEPSLGSDRLGATGLTNASDVEDVETEAGKDSARKRRMVSFREVQTMTSKLKQQPPQLQADTFNRSISAAALLTAAPKQDPPKPKLPPEEMERLKGRTLEELVSTERDYVSDLSIIIKTFLEPMRNQKMASVSELRILFGNVEEIYEANKSLLAEMEELLSTKNSGIGQVFLKSADLLMKLYMSYIGNYQTAISSAHSIASNNPKIETYLKSLEGSTVTRGLDLNAFLIKPVQRICKWPLILNEILKYTPPGNPDRDHLIDAYHALESITHDVNELKAFSENLQKMMEISTKLQGLQKDQTFRLIQPTRIFLREGLVHTLRPGSVKPRKSFFYLFNDVLLHAKPLHGGRLEYRDRIVFTQALIRDLLDTPTQKNAFEIIRVDGKRRALIVIFDDHKQKQAWFDEIFNCIVNNVNHSVRRDRLSRRLRTIARE